MANLRCGGEFGEDWHTAGNLTRKQNVFDDFLASAQYLVDKGDISPAHLAIEGRSNGGLLMGATLVQRPGLFKAVVSHVGIYDMLRVALAQRRIQRYRVRHSERSCAVSGLVRLLPVSPCR